MIITKLDFDTSEIIVLFIKNNRFLLRCYVIFAFLFYYLFYYSFIISLSLYIYIASFLWHLSFRSLIAFLITFSYRSYQCELRNFMNWFAEVKKDLFPFTYIWRKYLPHFKPIGKQLNSWKSLLKYINNACIIFADSFRSNIIARYIFKNFFLFSYILKIYCGISIYYKKK